MLSVTSLSCVASEKCWWWQVTTPVLRWHWTAASYQGKQRNSETERRLSEVLREEQSDRGNVAIFSTVILWTRRANGLYYVLCMHWIALQLYNCGVEADGDVSCQSWEMRRWSSNNQIIAAARSSAQRWELERSSHTSAVAGAVQVETNLREVRSFTIMEKAPTKAFSLLKTPITASIFKNLVDQPAHPLWPLHWHPNFTSTYCGLWPI